MNLSHYPASFAIPENVIAHFVKARNSAAQSLRATRKTDPDKARDFATVTTYLSKPTPAFFLSEMIRAKREADAIPARATGLAGENRQRQAEWMLICAEVLGFYEAQYPQQSDFWAKIACKLGLEGKVEGYNELSQSWPQPEPYRARYFRTIVLNHVQEIEAVFG